MVAKKMEDVNDDDGVIKRTAKLGRDNIDWVQRQPHIDGTTPKKKRESFERLRTLGAMMRDLKVNTEVARYAYTNMCFFLPENQ